ncbi:MAG: tryptophan--tRNA ligase [Patescibacteria group bacterium]
MSDKKILLSGMQPSGKMHIGNYLGALRQFVELYPSYDSLFMIADYHALTSLRRADQLRANIMEVAKDYLAIGLDPEKVVIFQQSDVPEHAELTWIFNCLVTVPFLMQAHAFKDKQSKGLEANVGLFDYPMLMAADILIYGTDVVPVGQDQRQHVEYAREAASKFNLAFGPVFKEPAEYIMENVAIIPGIDGRKMSKSYGNTIPLFGTDEEIKTAVANIKTDSTPKGQPMDKDKDTVFALHRHFSQKDLPDLEKNYQEGSIGYQESKNLLAENILNMIRPLRDRRDAISDKKVIDILKTGGEKARERAEEKMRVVRKAVGVTL